MNVRGGVAVRSPHHTLGFNAANIRRLANVLVRHDLAIGPMRASSLRVPAL